MTIDWNDTDKCIAFRVALEAVYFDYDELDRFVTERLGENLANISEKTKMSTVTFKLLYRWAKPDERKLAQLFAAFRAENPDHPVIATLQQPLLTRTSKLTAEDWETLFEQVSPDDFADIRRAFLRALRQVFSADFLTGQAVPSPLHEPDQIQAFLVRHDNPKLALRFVEFVIVELQRSDEESSRDLTALEAWRDRIAQKYNILVEAPEPSAPTARHGYLLVALKESGRKTQEGADVTVFVELRVTGELTPIAFDATSVTCPFDQVARHVSRWIHKAEEALLPYECGRVTLELFLPCVHLEENIAAWEVQNEQGLPIALGGQRGFVVRSLERVLNRTTQTVLKQKWRLLENCVGVNNVYDRFHLQEACPVPGTLLTFLEDSLGLRLVAKLPSDREQRKALLYDIINSAVPIALWSTEFDQFSAAELKTQVDHLLSASQLTNFADLATQWRRKRAQNENGVIKNIRLLCDCPDRWPTLPDSTRTEDLLVS